MVIVVEVVVVARVVVGAGPLGPCLFLFLLLFPPLSLVPSSASRFKEVLPPSPLLF